MISHVIGQTWGRLGGDWEPKQAQVMAMLQALALALVLGQGQPRVLRWVLSAPAKGRLWLRLSALAWALAG